MDEKIIKALIELANYSVDYRTGMIVSTTFISEENKEILLNHFDKGNREETTKLLLKK